MSKRTFTPGMAAQRLEREPAAGLCRRTFLKRVALAGGALAVPCLVPGSALGLNGAVPPSGRILMGAIGIGSRGTVVLKSMLAQKDAQFFAVCDARKTQREAAKRSVDTRNGNGDCVMIRDLRELLATRKDLDAVLIALGERWHALASTWAMRAGKDVYCEKPGSLTIAQGRIVLETAKRYGRVFQTGTQRLSDANFIFAFELARTGRLGKLKRVRAQLTPYHTTVMRHDWLPAEPLPPVEEVDWDAWLGPCPWRPYNSLYVKGKWREHYDFHTGSIGEWGAHVIAEAQSGIGEVNTSPVEYHYVDNPTGEGMTMRFASGVELILQRDGWGLGHCGIRLEGTEGWVSVADLVPKAEASAPELLADYNRVVNDYLACTQRPLNHARDFFNCVRSRRPTVANPELMHHTMSTVHAANICMWLKRDLRYDPEAEEFVNDAEANRLRSRMMRAPWTV